MPGLRGPGFRPRRVLPLAGALLSFAVFLLVLRVWRGPGGYDVYYYALQIKALSRCGELLFYDSSLVYYVLYLINGLVRNPVLSVQILSSLSMAAIYWCLLVMSLRRGFSLYKTAVASIAVFNPASFYLLLEFTKNSFALALFFLSLTLLSGGGRRGRGAGTGGRNFFPALLSLVNIKNLPGLLFGLGAVFSHRIILAPVLLFLLHRAAGGFWKEPRFRRAFGIIAGAAVLLGFLALFFRWDFFSARMPPLDLEAPLRRLLQFNSRRLWPEERAFYILLQLSLFFLIPPALISRPFASASPFGLLAWLFVFPFFHFSWDGAAFRLLIMAPLFAAPWLMGRRLRSFSRAAGLLLAAGCVFFTAGAPQRLAAKGPDYGLYRRELGSLGTLAAGRRIIAHRGLAGFLWYEQGLRSENFVPPPEEGDYLRLVYHFSPGIFEPYLRDGEARPVALGGGYTLLEDRLWRRFYQDRRDLVFLRSEMNPYLPRPPSGFALNERAAALMGPG
jgi:hypothetical protein